MTSREPDSVSWVENDIRDEVNAHVIEIRPHEEEHGLTKKCTEVCSE